MGTHAIDITSHAIRLYSRGPQPPGHSPLLQVQESVPTCPLARAAGECMYASSICMSGGHACPPFEQLQLRVHCLLAAHAEPSPLPPAPSVHKPGTSWGTLLYSIVVVALFYILCKLMCKKWIMSIFKQQILHHLLIIVMLNYSAWSRSCTLG